MLSLFLFPPHILHFVFLFVSHALRTTNWSLLYSLRIDISRHTPPALWFPCPKLSYVMKFITFLPGCADVSELLVSVSLSENSTVDGELPRQPEGSVSGRPGSAVAGSHTDHL